MIPIEEMQEQFDGLFYKAISRILFSPDKNRKRYADALASMFSAMQSSDGTMTFHNAYNELKSAIEQSPRLIHSQEDLIFSFEGKYIPLNQRMQYLEMQVNKIGKIEIDIQKMKHNIAQKPDRTTFKEFRKEILLNLADEKRQKKDVFNNPKTTEVIPTVSEKTEEKIVKREKRKIRCGNRKHDFDSGVPIGKTAFCWRCRKENRKGSCFILTEDMVINK